MMFYLKRSWLMMSVSMLIGVSSLALADGSSSWADTNKANTVCRDGKNQSPINIVSQSVIDIKQSPIQFNYSMLVADELQREAGQIKVTMRSGGSIEYEGTEYGLSYFSLHAKSEHTVDGKYFPMEIQFVHESSKGDKAIVSMMFIPGKEDQVLNRLFNRMPTHVGESTRLSNTALKAIETDIKTTHYYMYNGSLSTSPCTEGVRRFLIKMPMKASTQQFAYLKQLLAGKDNNRSLQRLNARMVFE